MEAIFYGKKSNYVGAMVVSLILTLAPLALIPLVVEDEGVSGSTYILGAASVLFLWISLIFGRLALSPFYVALDGVGVYVYMGGKRTCLAWGEIEAIGVELEPKSSAPIALLTASLKTGKPTRARFWFYPRWSDEMKALVLFKLDDLKSDPAGLIETCKHRAASRWQYDLND